MDKKKEFSRRRFLKITGLATGSVTVGTLLQACGGEATPVPPTATPGATSQASVTAQVAMPTVPPPTLLPSGNKVESYLALAPATLRAGQTEQISVTLLNGSNLVSDTVQIALLKDGQEVAQVVGLVQGRSDLALKLPRLAEGAYQLQFKMPGFQNQAAVRVEQAVMLFVESDKPIYKPGQTIYLRIMTLDTALKPLAETVTVEIADAKAIKIYKKEVKTDQYGMASLEVPLSPEPNLGTWKITASLDKRKATRDVKVERYVLPKYGVTVDLPKEWALSDEPIIGTIKADYTYGKPVLGEVEIKASRYNGTWQEFATLTKPLNEQGQLKFELPAAQSVSGNAPGGVAGNVSLAVTVREKATGYEEKTTRFLRVTNSPLTLKIIPESVTFKPGLPLSLLIVAQDPDGKPADAEVSVWIDYIKNTYASANTNSNLSIKQGQGRIEITPASDVVALSVTATGQFPLNSNQSQPTGGNVSSGAQPRPNQTQLSMQASHSPSNSFLSLRQLNGGSLKVGEKANFRLTATGQATNFYYQVTARGSLVTSGFSATPDLTFPVTAAMSPDARLVVYQVLGNDEVTVDYLPFSVETSLAQPLEAKFDKPQVEPGQPVSLNVQTDGEAKVGLGVVDRSVFLLAENRLNLAEISTELGKLYAKPAIEKFQPVYARSSSLTVPGSKEIFGNAGVVVITNKTVPMGKTLVRSNNFAAGAAATTAASAARPPAGAPAPANVAETGAAASQDSGLAQVQRVRQFFPETWLWSDLVTDAAGKGSTKLTAPDSITTWMLHAVAVSPKNGLGIAQAQLQVLQPFFAQLDLVYSAIRGEEFPVKVALYNYTTQAEEFTVELEQSSWFDLLGATSQKVTVGPNDVGGLSFQVRPKELGKRQFKLTARSKNRADALIKDIIIEPEGVARELVENVIAESGKSYELDMAVPAGIIAGSSRSYLATTGNYLAQTIDGLENLIRMPNG